MSDEIKTQAPVATATAPVANKTTATTTDVMAQTVHSDSDPVVSPKELLAVGAHFGHQARRWNPAMKPFIYTKRNNLHIIDLNKTAVLLQAAYLALKKIVEQGGKVLFVGTKPIAKDTIVAEATRSGSFYVSNRWLGGTLTNFRTISHRIHLLKNLEDEADEGLLEKLSKKDAIARNKQHDRLNMLLGGIKEMRKVPNAIVIIDTKYEHNAVNEAKLLHIPSFGLVDTNCDPTVVDYPIPVNVDGPESVKLIVGILADAVVAGKGGEVEYAYKTDASNKETMKDILPAQFSVDDLRIIHSKIREDIFAAKRKGKKRKKANANSRFGKKFGNNRFHNNNGNGTNRQAATSNQPTDIKPAKTNVVPAAPAEKKEVTK